MTPLIDVVFILLVFFMLTTRLLPVNLLEVSTEVQSESGGHQGEQVPEIRILAGQQLEWNHQIYPLNDLVRQLTGAAIDRVNVTSAPDANVHDFTLALSTLGASGIEPNWMRAKDGDVDR
ncbi:biopolymer transporter ExbD [Marinobacter sp. SS13-12]|uniref:ExbD/TolR family protein n=1 Tax=Marinobacter sp. SS13-12 TaxID=3050451 RepID=UPI0025534EE9|nr:biopolymer transporter ExbD [Marinobacter sp. SS13-12]MDK8465791.1 biopolymer transporter ExbD [Marinobacter sp. SS13-12]